LYEKKEKEERLTRNRKNFSKKDKTRKWDGERYKYIPIKQVAV
jgi:hypothetical protein